LHKIYNAFPIYRNELHKFFSIVFLMFNILNAQNLLRALKDNVISYYLGFEATNVLKSFAIIPVTMLITMLYIKLVTIFTPLTVFYIFYISFIVVFVVFAFVVLPNHHILNVSDSTLSYWVDLYPAFKWFILCAGKWVFSLFYILCEMWPVIMYSLLFWQFVNSFILPSESKRFYIAFGVIGQLAQFFVSFFLQNRYLLQDYIHSSEITIFKYIFVSDYDDLVTQITVMTVCISGVLGVYALYYINNYIIDSKTLNKEQLVENRRHLGLIDSIRFVLQHRYILMLFGILITYGICVNLSEIYWKSVCRQYYTTKMDFAVFQGNVMFYNAICTIIGNLLGSFILTRVRWIYIAMITPVILLISGSIFFIVAEYVYIYPEILFVKYGIQGVYMVIILGAVSNVLTKSAKYSTFDSSKEMLYTVLSHEVKTKGKAVAITGNKGGKGISSFFLTLVVLPFYGDYVSAGKLMFIVFFITVLVWIFLVNRLDDEYNRRVANKT
ncbi:MAG: Npt1/Npt2 family nucleotide transporter, partial [Pseudomonadota bacterium]